VMGEARFNRSHDEYMGIARNLHPLKKLTSMINERSQELHRLYGPLPELCR